MAGIVTVIKAAAKIAGTIATVAGIINSAGSIVEFDLELNGWKLDNISYINRNIYIPLEKNLKII